MRLCVLRSEMAARGGTRMPRLEPQTNSSRRGAHPLSDLLFLYFTSGTTARPKLVAHTQVSYPVGHLSTMYWLGIKPGDVHLNVSSPGWAKHAWSCFLRRGMHRPPYLAYQYERFDACAVARSAGSPCGVTTFCAPPTVWRMLIQQGLWEVARAAARGRERRRAAEPRVINRVRDAWGLTLRDGFGQTETTALVGNPPAAGEGRLHGAAAARPTCRPRRCRRSSSAMRGDFVDLADRADSR